VKVIVDTADKERVIGFHILSPNAGEITQGISVAMKCGLTKTELDDTVGIHPTIAEEYTTLTMTTDDGDGKKEGC
jgi:pyruvate/2-oxoglutarate dehydrogenase complex dihydrolipoamide dehydrogenase (E3) component